MSEHINYKYIINSSTTSEEKVQALKPIREKFVNLKFFFEFFLEEDNLTILYVTSASLQHAFNDAGSTYNSYYLNSLTDLKTYYDLTGTLIDYSTT